MVSFSRYFTVCITYQPPLVNKYIERNLCVKLDSYQEASAISVYIVKGFVYVIEMDFVLHKVGTTFLYV